MLPFSIKSRLQVSPLSSFPKIKYFYFQGTKRILLLSNKQMLSDENEKYQYWQYSHFLIRKYIKKRSGFEFLIPKFIKKRGGFNFLIPKLTKKRGGSE